ncbi:MAG: hypothetical protein M3P08_16240 [Thermoproteota archaeon]|nr:hypothetical protein [Thermoproteota archaeon]
MLSKPIRDDILGRIVRPATEFDGETGDAIFEAVPGHDRDGEVRDKYEARNCESSCTWRENYRLHYGHVFL